MGFKVSSDNIRLQERLRLDHIATKLLPSNFPVGSIVQIATSQSTGQAGFSGSGFTSSWNACLLYTSPSPRDQRGSGFPASA